MALQLEGDRRERGSCTCSCFVFVLGHGYGSATGVTRDGLVGSFESVNGSQIDALARGSGSLKEPADVGLSNGRPGCSAPG